MARDDSKQRVGHTLRLREPMGRFHFAFLAAFATIAAGCSVTQNLGHDLDAQGPADGTTSPDAAGDAVMAADTPGSDGDAIGPTDAPEAEGDVLAPSSDALEA